MIPLGILAQGGVVYTSWTKSNTPATIPYHSITHLPLAAGNWWMFGSGSGGTSTTNYYYSTNGTSWTTGTFPLSREWGLSATNGTTIMAHVTRGSVPEYLTSTNGTTWTQRTIPTASAVSFVLKHLDGRFWRGQSGGLIHSTDAINWTSLSIGSQDIDFGNGTYITIASTNRICTGDPTVVGNWTTLTLPDIVNGAPTTVAFGNGVWVVGYSGSGVTGYAYSLNNGSTWLTGNLPASLGLSSTQSGAQWAERQNTRIRVADGVFYYSINNAVYYSIDGINWVTVSTGTGLTFNSKAIASNGLGTALMVGVGGTNISNVASYLRGA